MNENLGPDVLSEPLAVAAGSSCAFAAGTWRHEVKTQARVSPIILHSVFRSMRSSLIQFMIDKELPDALNTSGIETRVKYGFERDSDVPGGDSDWAPYFLSRSSTGVAKKLCDSPVEEK